VLRKK